MSARLIAIAMLVASCGVAAPPHAASPTPTVPPPAAQSATAVPTATPSPVPTPTVTAAPRTTQAIAGLEFVLVGGPADLRLDPRITAEEQARLVAALEADIPAVEREFERTFTRRPVIYAFGGVESYTEGLARIFGYPRATATFVAENSIAFFEPALRLIAVNWEAVRDRRPIAAMRHELTHLLTLDACAPRCDLVPAWLNEGQARLAEATIPGGDWRLQRVRYESASMAETATLIPLDQLVSQSSWNALVDWAGYYKYQQAARVVELLREDVGGTAPIARVYERLRRGQNVAEAYRTLTGRSFEDFVASLPARMRGAVREPRGVVVVPAVGAPPSYLLYGFAPSAMLKLTISGPRGSETWPIAVSPYGASFEGLAPTRMPGRYLISVHDERQVFTVRLHKLEPGSPRDSR